jgi:hypothetical protein
MENREAGIEPGNKELRKFTYRDNSAGGKTVFECVAGDILEADRLYQEKTGNNPAKQNHIGCSVERVPEEKENQ